MKITIYELLGMVKDGNAPKKIKYMGYIFEYDTNHKRYESYFDEQIWTLNEFVNIDDNLNDEVEILEEEKKMPEKLDISNFPKHNNSLKKTAIKVNEIIDYLKSKGDE